MLQFFTSIPVKLQIEIKNEEFGKALVFAPIIGLIIGSIIAGSFYISRCIFPTSIAAALVIVLYILLTGGLHMDGLGDTFDGIFSNRSKDRMLEIMRDSRVGTNAVLAIASVILLNWVLISGMSEEYTLKILILFPVAGRIGSLTGACVSKYARSGEGLGKSFIDLCSWKELGVGIFFHAIIFFCVLHIKGLILSLIPIFMSFILVKFLGKKIDGATGDILGAVCELNQTGFLLATYVFINFYF
ncbi:Cobalamin synthase [Pseudobacteroides cellulosolvens ATCC 35603 = DSM 2933]|uniref:Adenosylcobinamide-GDP ribazoletransferase n=2 Tax=Pseudobacteroides cellulosolvens TaxID=35825 RepID=A0A0L6JQC6_9FIRM|nr:Cobalamin synthase [Pseudobacteroides cellulosolvens ATCC 35603 = DSM 2933]